MNLRHKLWSCKALMDLPAALAIILAGATALALSNWNPVKVRDRYEDAARSALAQGDYPTAVIAAQRLLGFGGTARNEAIFIPAKAKMVLGQAGDAYRLLEMIAPFDKPVYAPAHILVAEILLEENAAAKSPDPRILSQLQNALALDPESGEALEMLGTYELRRGNLVEARKACEKAASQRPEVIFKLIDLSRSLGDEQSAGLWIERALEVFRPRVVGAVKPDEADRLYLAEALLQARKFQAAFEVLAEAPDFSSNATERRRYALVCAA
jgi:tetratricopeptide (TPR) repeat protein